MKKTIEMFNPLVIRSSHDYIKEFNKYRLQIIIDFENLALYCPEIHENNGATKLMFPNDARLRNFTYTSNFTLDLNITYVINKGDNMEQEERKHVKLSKIQFGKIPIMLEIYAFVFLTNITLYQTNKLTNVVWILVDISLSMVQKRHVLDKKRQQITNSIHSK